MTWNFSPELVARRRLKLAACNPHLTLSTAGKYRLLFKQGIWTGGGGSIVAALPARLEDLLLINPAGRLQALATNLDAESNASLTVNASELNATAPAKASEPAASVNATAASAWSYSG